MRRARRHGLLAAVLGLLAAESALALQAGPEAAIPPAAAAIAPAAEARPPAETAQAPQQRPRRPRRPATKPVPAPPMPVPPQAATPSLPERRDLEPAPVPNRSLEPPWMVQRAEGPRLAPSIIQRRLPGQGQAAEGSPSITEERLFAPAAGAHIKVPFSY